MDDLDIRLFAGPAEFEAWLEEHAEASPGLWLKIAKKGAPEPSVTYAQAVELHWNRLARGRSRTPANLGGWTGVV